MSRNLKEDEKQIQSVLQINEVEIENVNRSNGFDNAHRFNEISRLKARLQIVKNEKANRTHSSLGHSMNPVVADNWMIDPPSPPPSPRSHHSRNRLVSQETHYIKTQYQESESKIDDTGVKVESRLCSHVRMAVQQNERGANDIRHLDDPMLRLVFLAKEVADQAAQIDFLAEHFPRMNSAPSVPSSFPHPMALQNQNSLPTGSMDPSKDKIYGHLPLTNSTTSTLPPVHYLLKKLQEAEEQCLELKKTKQELEALLMEAFTYRRDLEVSVQGLAEELEEARATNTSLSDELASSREEIVTLSNGFKKLEDELERTQNRLGDVTVQVSDLESERTSLHEMVGEKDKEIDENMVLLKDQHKTVVDVIDYTRETRRLMTNLQEKLQPKSEEDSEENIDPARAKEAMDDLLKEVLPQIDAIETALGTCQSQLAVKVHPEANDNESSEAHKGRWPLFRFGR